MNGEEYAVMCESLFISSHFKLDVLLITDGKILWEQQRFTIYPYLVHPLLVPAHLNGLFNL